MVVEMVHHRCSYGYTATVVNYTMTTTCDVNYYGDRDLIAVAIWTYVLTAAGTAAAADIDDAPAPAHVIVVVSYLVIPIAPFATVVD